LYEYVIEDNECYEEEFESYEEYNEMLGKWNVIIRHLLLLYMCEYVC
jgi:hypothetical protein